MGKPKNTLTDWPEDLKDVIDWFLRLAEMDEGGSGYSNKTKLKKAVEKLNGFSKEVSGLGTINVAGFFNKVTNGLQKGWHAAKSGYTSSYNDEPQWKDDSNYTQTSALIFLGTVPIVYLVMSYIYWRCSNSQNGDWIGHSINSTNQQFGKFMSTMGFDTTRLNGNIQGNQVATLLAEEDIHCFSEFTNPQKSTYEAFLTNLEQSAIGSAINHPLASCYKVAEKYFESQKANGKHITQPIKAIKDNLIQLSATEEYSSSGDSSTNPYDNLKRLITQLLSAVQKFQAKEPEQFGPDVHHAAGQAGKVSGAPGGQPSSGGSIAGALTTLGLGGGATAAYIFNIGGAKTIVNGLLKIG